MNASRSHALRSLIAIAGVAGSLATAQIILSERVWRIDLTQERSHVLSDHALQILGALDYDVAVTAFVRSDDPRNREIEDLLRRARAASSRFRYQVLDVNRNPAVAWQYGVDAFGAVVVESEGRRKEFPNPDEQTLMAAIVHVTRPGRRRVYFLQGHGEHGIRDRNRRSGYSYAQVALIKELYEVEELRLGESQPVPEDADALVIAGPRANLSASALRHVDAYLRSGGGVLVLLDPGQTSNVIELLGRYGVAVSSELVLDEENRLFAGDYLTLLVPGRSTAHPIGAGLKEPPLMSQVRPVTTAGTELTEAGLDLLMTSRSSWRTGDLSVLGTGVGNYRPEADAPGPVSVGVSVLVRGRGEEPGRLLVYGDSDFATNFFLDYLGNRDLFLNSVNWLAEEDTLVASRPPVQLPGVNQLFVSARQGRSVFWAGTVIQPAAILLLGIIVYMRRRITG